MSVCVICQEGASLAIYKDKLQINRISIDESLMRRGKAAEAYNGATAKLAQKKGKREKGIFLLPQNMYSVDYAVVPSVGKAKSKEFLRAELKTRHKNCGDLAVSFSMIKSGGSNATYRLILVKKSLLGQIKSAFLKANIRIIAFVPFGVAAVEGAALLNPDIKNDSVMLLMADGKKGFLAEYVNGALIGDGSIPYGTNALSDKEALSERLFCRYEDAWFAVFNAYERAGAGVMSLIERMNDFLVGKKSVASERSSEGETQSRVKEYDSAARGMIAGNFRMFDRRIMAAERELRYGENAVKISAVYLYMPPEFGFLAALKSEEDSRIKWINLVGGEYGNINDISRLALEGTEAAFLKIKPRAFAGSRTIEPTAQSDKNSDGKTPSKKKKRNAELSAPPYFRV